MKSEEKIIAVQPLGHVRGDVVEVIAANLETFFQIRTEVFPDQPIPDKAHNPRRGQYNCYPILGSLGTLRPDHAIKIQPKDILELNQGSGKRQRILVNIEFAFQ